VCLGGQVQFGASVLDALERRGSDARVDEDRDREVVGYQTLGVRDGFVVEVAQSIVGAVPHEHACDVAENPGGAVVPRTSRSCPPVTMSGSFHEHDERIAHLFEGALFEP
jgi:hypothetical protein